MLFRSGQSKRKTPEQMVEHLRKFSCDLRFTAGVWFFAPGGGRFHDRYVPPITMEETLEKAASLRRYGLAGAEATGPAELMVALDEATRAATATVIDMTRFDA